MIHRRRRRILLSSLASGFLFLPFACGSEGGSGCGGRGVSGGSLGCPALKTEGAARGLTADGRVDVSAAVAFPGRPPGPAPSPQDLASACAAYAACTAAAKEDAYTTFQSCLRGALVLPPGPIALAAGERAIPFDGTNESFPFFVQTVLAAGGDCAATRSVLTERLDSIACQEDGCYSEATDRIDVTCSGDVATITIGGTSTTRDCSRASAHCSTASPTGCTDRPLVACTSPAKDRCDGDVKLGCDHCGLVSYHDCAWNGGHCEESAGGAKCVDAGDARGCFSLRNDCTGTTFGACVSGNPVTVDCGAFGMHCEKLPTGALHEGDASDRCGLAPCAAPVCVTGASHADAGAGDAG